VFQHREYKIDEEKHNPSKDFRLEKTYELCISELGLQQKKRDQTIAFYIAVISFVIPALLDMGSASPAKAAGFWALYVLGGLLSLVVVRYRVYKEIYWITCRTINQLYHYKQEAINKELVQHHFYKNIEKNAGSVYVFHKGADDGNEKKVMRFKSLVKIFNSAETILYQVLVLMGSMVLWIALYSSIKSEFWAIGIASVVVLINHYLLSAYYVKHLTEVYDVILDGKDASFNASYSKAWFLHFH